VFQQRFGFLEDGTKVKHYDVPESVGIATGRLITALHQAGLVCLIYTPSSIGFIIRECSDQKDWPSRLLVSGYPEEVVRVPDIGKRSLEENVILV
jgi:hypothetical protein